MKRAGEKYIRTDGSANQRPSVRIGPRKIHEKTAEIRLVKDGDSVQAIKVVCACGEEIDITCIYPDSK